ncbi:MAG: regulatory protein RecX [Candidatus Limnocylindrales bacterium]|jgi:regulatory protein
MPRPSGRDRLEARRARLERHAAESDPEVVLNAAARFLELRSRSVQEVRRHLGTARYPDPLIEAAIARLLELGMLDDAAFARAWVESRDRARPRGAQALRRELALKGIDREVAVGALADRDRAGADEADRDFLAVSADETAAERLLGKNRASLARIADPRVRRQRAYALLARNGFDPEVCREVSARIAEPATQDD